MSDKGATVVGFTIFTLALGGIFILARVATRTLIKPQFGLDDAFIILTWFVILGYNVCSFIAVGHGFGRHASTLSPQEIVAAAHAVVMGEVFAIFAYPSGKAAVACLLMRIFPGRRLKWILWTFVAVNAIYFYASGILLLVQCDPVAYQWNKSIKGGTCWNPSIVASLGYGTGALGAFTDLTFAIIPWFYIANLKMPRKKKIAVGAALSAGLFPFLCSLIKIYYNSTLGVHSDPTYDTIPLVLVSEAELCAINIAACIPTLFPLYLWLIGKPPKSLAAASPAWTPDLGRSGFSSRLLGTPPRKKPTATELSSVDDYNNYIIKDSHRQSGGSQERNDY